MKSRGQTGSSEPLPRGPDPCYVGFMIMVNRLHSRRIAAGVLGVAALASSISPAPARADDYSDIRSSMQDMGIAPHVQDQLINKLEQGEVWESLQANSEPVATEVRIARGKRITMDVFSDGSRTSLSQDIPKSSASQNVTAYGPTSLKYCSYRGSAGYGGKWTGCQARFNAILMLMQFNFDYEYWRDDRNSITRTYAPVCDMISPTGSVSDPKWQVISSRDKRMTCIYKINGISQTTWIGARVSGATASVYHR